MTLKIWNGSTWANVTPGTGGTGGPVTAPSFVGPYTIGQWAGGGGHPALWRTDITQDTVGKYALMSDTLNTYVNAQPGGKVNLLANHSTTAWADASTFTVNNARNLIVGDGFSTGAWAGGSTYAALWKNSIAQTDGNRYALLADTSGNTFINALSGQTVWVRVANTDVAYFRPGGFYLPGNGGIITGGSVSNYGATSFQGDKNGWSGLDFRSAGGANLGTLMVQATASGANTGWGMYSSADNAWLTYWSGGVYQGLSATTGAFSGALTGTSGAFSSTLSGAGVTVTGGQYLYINSTGSQFGRMVATGNFHIDTINGGNTYLNWFGGGRVIIGNGAGAATGYFSSGPITASGISTGAWGDTGISATNDIITTRSGNTTGVIYFDVPTAHYLFWSGTQYVMPSASASIGGVTVGSAAWAKEAITQIPVGDGLRVLRGLTPRKFYWRKGQHADTGLQAGFVREEVAAVAPDSVTEDFDGANGERHPGGYRMDHLLAYLWQAVRELTDEVEMLKAKVAA